MIILIYYGLYSGVSRYTLTMSEYVYCAPGVLIVLFHISLVVVKFAVQVVNLYG